MRTTNGSYRYRASASLGTFQEAKYSHQSMGYLDPGALAFLLAAQVVVRDVDARSIKRIRERLEPRPADVFAAAIRLLAEDRIGLIDRLALPDPTTWPAPAPLAKYVERLDDDSIAEQYDDRPLRNAVAAKVHNRGRSTFRVRAGHSRRGAG